jgi:hypothetical protein
MGMVLVSIWTTSTHLEELGQQIKKKEKLEWDSCMRQETAWSKYYAGKISLVASHHSKQLQTSECNSSQDSETLGLPEWTDR